MLRTRWTTQEKEKVKTLYNSGLSDTQIAVKTGRSTKAIQIIRGRIGAVKFHIEREKGIKVGPRAKPRPGKMPEGAQLVMEDILPNIPRDNAIKANEAFFGKEATHRSKTLAGNEEIYPGPAIQKTINSDIGISGTINIYNHDGETDFTITNLAPRNAISILAKIISKLVLE
jgi:hypothetical protein